MGLRGPARKADDDQIALGDPGRRAKRRKREAQEAADKKPPADLEVMRPAMPDYLIEEAVEHWNFLIPQLERAGIIRAVDVDLLADYCQSMGKAIKYERFCQECGDFTKRGSNKGVRPEVKLGLTFRDRANKLADKLGLTPKARAAMGIRIDRPKSLAEAAEDAELEEICNRRRR